MNAVTPMTPPTPPADEAARHSGPADSATSLEIVRSRSRGHNSDDAAHRLRHMPPSEHLEAVTRLGDETERMAEIRQELYAGIEELTGRRLGEVETLRAVADGASHYRDVARRTGQSDAAAEATVAGLVREGFLLRHRHPLEQRPDAEPTLVSLLPSGQALIAQVDAIRLRLLDAVVETWTTDGALATGVTSRMIEAAIDSSATTGADSSRGVGQPPLEC